MIKNSKAKTAQHSCNCGENCTCGKSRKSKLLGITICTLGILILGYQIKNMSHGRGDRHMGRMEFSMKDGNICDHIDRIERRADRGDVKAQMQLFELYSNDCSALPNASLKKSLWILRAAWEENFAPAQFKIALLYEFGDGFPRNYRETIKWFKISADQGYPHSEYELAKKYRDGSDFLEADENQYIFWLDRAARHGSEKAASDLANLYENGIFVEQDLIEAYKWYSLATFIDAKKLNALEDIMTTEELDEAQRKAVVLQKEIFKYITKNPELF